jgi:bifunctional non-homologous end joining protein LigD
MKKPTTAERRLHAYRRKRTAGATPEPMGGGQSRPRLFVVQQHAARRLHHDFRLEWDDVLLSWAVPRGPSLDPSIKRLAVQVEDHPVEYADFEGLIPEGNYGAGAVIVWDRGRWTPLEDVNEGLRRGKLLFELEGYKLRGTWTLVRTGGKSRPDSKEWLLIKKPDAYAVSGESEDEARLPPESVLSGLTLAELRAGPERLARVRRRLSRLGAPKGSVSARGTRPMLAERCARPFSRPGWLFEVKYDGYRCIAERHGESAELRSRRGRDLSHTFPELVRAFEALPVEHLVLDGEIVAMDAEGRPVFQRLQERAQLRNPRDVKQATAHLRNPRDVKQAALEIPVAMFAFDLLAFEGYDLRTLPLSVRKSALEELLPKRGPLRYSAHFEERGEDVYEEITRRRLEGMVAKKSDSPYVSRRSANWRKIRALKTDDFVIVGFTRPRGSRIGLGALHLAAYVGPDLVYAGRVGSGFDDRQLAELRRELDAIARPSPAFAAPAKLAAASVFVEPRLACEVRYTELTSDGSLRQPVFLRLRDDKAPEECVHPMHASAVAHPAPNFEPSEATPDDPRATPPEVPFTNLDKVFWPREKITKGDLIEYHRRIAPWILPYLRDRPLVLTRYPDGVEGKSFFQKDAPGWVPRTARSTTSCATSWSSCSTSSTWAPSPSTCGRAGSRRSSIRTGASSTSIPRARRSSTSSGSRGRPADSARASSCRPS